MSTDSRLLQIAKLQLLKRGWATSSWERTRSLQQLAEILFLEKSKPRMHKLGKYTKLLAVSKTEARIGSKSAIRGLDSFPLHTDEASRRLPPRYVVLRALSGTSNAVTFLLHFSPDHIDGKLLSDLTYGLWACRGAREPHISPVWENERIKWDEDCMRPLDRLARRAHSEFREFIVSSSKVSYQWSNRSSILLIDNWRTMHGRAGVWTEERRTLERLYVEIA